MGEKLLASTRGFRLGIDWSTSPENIGIESVVQALQCEFDRTDGALRTVAGVRIAYDAGIEVESLFYDINRKRFYFNSGNNLYYTDLHTHELIGQLTGTKKPKYHIYDGDVLIASGGKLQAITGSGTLITIDDSPACEFVSSYSGRVIVSSIYGHSVYWSAIGDYKSWKNNTNDASSGQYVDVGYKDQGTIISLDFLGKSILVYKQYGKVYQVIGSPADSYFSVFPLSTTGYCSGSALNIDDRSYYLGNSGLMSFMPTNTYANIQPFETGLNINAYIIKNIKDTCEMWHVPSRKQIWIKPENGNLVFLYHYIPRYEDGRGVFTSRKLSHVLHEVVDYNKDVYMAYGTKIGILDERLDTDDGEQIQTSIISGNRLATKLFILLMNYDFVAHNIIDGYGNVQISNRTPKQIKFASKDERLNDEDGVLLHDYSDLLSQDEYTKVYKIGGGANRNLQIKIFVQKGAISIRQFDYNYEEV